jgi:hypothetical protein
MHFTKSKKCNESWECLLNRQASPPPPPPFSPQEDNMPNTPPTPHTASLSDADNMPAFELPSRLPQVPDSPTGLPEPWAKEACQFAVEEVEDEEVVSRFIVKYPFAVADILGVGKTAFQKLHEKQLASGLPSWAPFKDEEEWTLAQWLVNRVNKTGIEEYLKLKIVGHFLLHDYYVMSNLLD